jgi:hypothetical protein
VIDWREAHHWLRGYSEAKAGKPRNPAYSDSPAYGRGYDVGSSR